MKNITTKLFGFPIRIHWSILGLYAISLLSVWSTYHTVEAVLMDALLVTGVVISIILHEFGHILAAKTRGYKTHRMTLMILGGVAEIEPGFEYYPKSEFFITIFGPAVNAVIFFIIMLISPDKLLEFLKGNHIFELNYFWQQIAVVNVFLMIFNLLPIFPMDGGRLVRSITHMVTGDYSKSTKIANYLSIGVAGLVGIWFISIGAIMATIIMGLAILMNILNLRKS